MDIVPIGAGILDADMAIAAGGEVQVYYRPTFQPYSGRNPIGTSGGALGGVRYLWDLYSGMDKFGQDYVKSQIPFYGDYLGMKEQHRYWDDYRKNTGIEPLYPYRTYMNFGTSLAYQASGLYSRSRNFFRQDGYVPSRFARPDVMYG